MSSSDPNAPAAVVAAPPQPDLFWRWKWLLIGPGLLTLAVCLTAALLPDGVLWCWGPTLYESTAIVEMQDTHPIGEPAPARLDPAKAVMAVKTRALSWSAIREIVLSRKVDFGREIDPDNRRELERIYSEVQRNTFVRPLGNGHLLIAHRSPSPERNAALVNEIVKKFVGEDRREAQQRAKADLKYSRDKLAIAKTALSDIDNQIREFNQQNPWLGGTLAETQKEYDNTAAEELRILAQIKATEESLEELKKELAREKPEFVKIVPGQVPQEILELVKAAAEALHYFEQVDRKLTKAHPRWQEAYDVYERAAAALKEKGTAKPEEQKVIEPNPRFADLQVRKARMEKELAKLTVQKLDANKRASELYIRRRRAPELLGERQALLEQRAAAASVVEEYLPGLRLAEKEMARLMSEAHSSRFSVREYARDDRRPVRYDDPPGVSREDDSSASALTTEDDGGDSKEDPALAAIQAKMLLYAGGTAAALVPAILLLVLARVAARRSDRGAGPPGRAGRTVAALAVALCAVLPPVALWAALAHVHAEHRLGPEPASPASDAGGTTGPAERAGSEAPVPEKAPGGPVLVKAFQRSDTRFPQLDSDFLITAVNHYFRETKPEKEEGFTVNPESDGRGTLVAYRLKNLATTDLYEFRNVPVKWIGGEWTITEEGWRKIRDELRVKMRLRLGDPRP